MKRLVILFLFLGIGMSYGQTKEELLAKQKPLKDSIGKYKKEVDAIQSQIDALPGWRLHAFGNIGGSVSGFNNWYAKDVPNASVGNFGFIINATADLIQEKYFWKNATNINISWVKFDDKDDPNDESKYEVATDVFQLSSLYGYNLSKKFAISAFAEYRSTLVQNFNDPGFLDLGVGATWLPFKDMTVVIHPLNYNFVFSRGDNMYESSMGAKIVADYKHSFGKLSASSNLSIFASYKGNDYSNVTWTNSLSYTVWKNIGLGFDFGLRKNKQEAFNYQRESDPGLELANADNKLQSYWQFGLTFKFDK